MTYPLTHASGRRCRLYIDGNGLARLIVYRSGDRRWKDVNRQFTVPAGQIEAAIKRGEHYTRVAFEDGTNSMVQTGRLSVSGISGPPFGSGLDL